MDRGVLEASQLKTAFARLEEEQGGSITAVQDLLKWTLIDSAIKEGVVSFTVLRCVMSVVSLAALAIDDAKLRRKLGMSLRDGAVEETARGHGQAGVHTCVLSGRLPHSSPCSWECHVVSCHAMSRKMTFVVDDDATPSWTKFLENRP